MLNNSVEEITTNYLLALGYLGDMRSAILHYRLNLSKAVPGKASGDAIGTAETALAKWTAALEVPESKYAPTVVTDTEKAIYADYKVVWREYLEAERDTFGLLKAGKFDDAIEHLNRMTANR
jgi:hypothetical protein